MVAVNLRTSLLMGGRWTRSSFVRRMLLFWRCGRSEPRRDGPGSTLTLGQLSSIAVAGLLNEFSRQPSEESLEDVAEGVVVD